jgi:23S rRNA pseudouridine1911/1915/1917 synthase
MENLRDALQFVADRGDAGRRLDQALVRRLVAVRRMSRSLAQRWIESGAVTVNGRVALRPATSLRAGSSVSVQLPASAVLRARPAPEAGPLDVLYEDASLVILNKPPGVVVHPSYKQASGTLLNALLGRLEARPEARPGILTRLDRGTSGVVIVPLGGAVHAAMQRLAAAGGLRKEYLAVVCGVPHPPLGRIDFPLARDPEDRRRVVTMPGGAASETRYEVVSHSAATSVVRCELITGRTHQIRVHLAASGWPIVGDALYGEPDPRIARQALHAWRVSFRHPVSGDAVSVTAPVPDDLAKVIGQSA